MKKVVLALLISVSLISCKKNSEDQVCPDPVTHPTTASANDYFQLAVGNYWVYDRYRIDTNGVETLSSYDSSYVSGDTIVNGIQWYILHDLYFVKWLRDSAGYILDTNNSVNFTNAIFNTNVSFEYVNGIAYLESACISPQTNITVPVGNFSTYEWRTQITSVQVNYPWDPVRYAHSYYAEGIGKVKQVYFFASGPDYYERRLARYHVQ
jgi:hypothetical protein